MKKAVRLLIVAALTVLPVFLMNYSPSYADMYWVGGRGSWDDPANWSLIPGGPGGAGPPQDRENVFLIQSDNINRTVNYVNTLDQVGYLQSLTIDATGSGAMTLNQTTDRLGAFREYIGYDGSGIVNQSGGGSTGFAGSLYLGYNPTGSGIYNLEGGDLHRVLTFVGYSGIGVFNNTGGRHTHEGSLNVGTNSGGVGTYNLSGTGYAQGEAVFIGGNGGTGTFNQSGGTVDPGNALSVRSGGTYNLSGGTILKHTFQDIYSGGTFNQTGGINNTSNLTVDGVFNYSGGEIITTNDIVINQGTLNLSGSGTRTVNGNVVNNGTVKTTHTVVVFNGIFTNNGAYISDPATQYFNTLIIGQSGYLVGQHSDKFYINADFINNSTMNTFWNTKQAYLGFIAGQSNQHAFYITGADYGAVMSGFDNNFSWGTLDITGNLLSLLDGNTDLGGALYLRYILGLQMSGDDILNIFSTDGLDIYYMANLAENGYLHGLTYDLEGGGHLRPISTPEPATTLLLGLGLVGLAGIRKRFSS